MTTLGRILAVEDDEAMRMFLEEELRDAGYDVVTATNGIAALHLFNPSTIDVVVSDVIMPGMRGDELHAELHARHTTCRSS
jgi:CheY-like chemotaxis protein